MADAEEFTKALRDARLSAASKLDAVLGLSDARSLRLDALRAEILPVIAGNPEARSLFALTIEPGVAPKLWIDLISSVVMEPDPKTYRLLQDQDHRRETVFESSDLKAMSRFIVKYLAHRLVAREKLERTSSPSAETAQKPHAFADLVYVWLTGAVVGGLGALIIAMLLGKISF
jgi:hypothetical protein